MSDALAHIYFDRDLTVGQEVELRWTNSGSYYAAPAVVTKVNGSTVRARTTEDIVRAGKVRYPKGTEIKAPRMLGTGYSQNNGVFPRSENGKVSRRAELDAMAENLASRIVDKMYAEGGKFEIVSSGPVSLSSLVG